MCVASFPFALSSSWPKHDDQHTRQRDGAPNPVPDVHLGGTPSPNALVSDPGRPMRRRALPLLTLIPSKSQPHKKESRMKNPP